MTGKRIFARMAALTLFFGMSEPAFAAMKIGQNLSNPYWYSETSDPFTAGFANVTGDNPWKPAFLQENSIFNCIRPMDYTGINVSESFAPADKSWEGRTKRGAPKQMPVAYEWIVDIANRTNTNLWLNLPHYASEDDHYTMELAKVIKASLNSNLLIYLEYSNETWNTAGSYLAQNLRCRERGTALGLPGFNEFYRGWAYHVYAACRLYKNFRDVFGSDSTRLRLVIAGQAGYTAQTEHHMLALNDPLCNPNKFKPYCYAIAPYFDGCSLVDMAGNIQNVGKTVRDIMAIVKPAGMKLYCYEGGQSCYNDNADVVNRKPEMYGLYRQYLDTLSANGIELFMHLASACAWTSGQAFGSKEFIGQDPAQANKYRALADFITANGGKGVANPVYIVPGVTGKAVQKKQYALRTERLFTIDGQLINRKDLRRASPAAVYLVLTERNHTIGVRAVAHTASR